MSVARCEFCGMGAPELAFSFFSCGSRMPGKEVLSIAKDRSLACKEIEKLNMSLAQARLEIEMKELQCT